MKGKNVIYVGDFILKLSGVSATVCITSVIACVIMRPWLESYRQSTTTFLASFPTSHLVVLLAATTAQWPSLGTSTYGRLKQASEDWKIIQQKEAQKNVVCANHGTSVSVHRICCIPVIRMWYMETQTNWWRVSSELFVRYNILFDFSCWENRKQSHGHRRWCVSRCLTVCRQLYSLQPSSDLTISPKHFSLPSFVSTEWPDEWKWGMQASTLDWDVSEFTELWTGLVHGSSFYSTICIS